MYQCPKCGRWCSPFNHDCPAEPVGTPPSNPGIPGFWPSFLVPFILVSGALLGNWLMSLM